MPSDRRATRLAPVVTCRRFFVFSPDNLLLRWFENEKEYRAGHSKGELEVISCRPAVEGSLIIEIRGALGRHLLVRSDIADVHLIKVIKDQLPAEDPFSIQSQGISEKSAPLPSTRATDAEQSVAGSEASRMTSPASTGGGGSTMDRSATLLGGKYGAKLKMAGSIAAKAGRRGSAATLDGASWAAATIGSSKLLGGAGANLATDASTLGTARGKVPLFGRGKAGTSSERLQAAPGAAAANSGAQRAAAQREAEDDDLGNLGNLDTGPDTSLIDNLIGVHTRTFRAVSTDAEMAPPVAAVGNTARRLSRASGMGHSSAGLPQEAERQDQLFKKMMEGEVRRDAAPRACTACAACAACAACVV